LLKRFSDSTQDVLLDAVSLLRAANTKRLCDHGLTLRVREIKMAQSAAERPAKKANANFQS
jgi:hypothetical protein